MLDKPEQAGFIRVGTIDRLRKLGRGSSRIFSCDGVDVAVFQMKPGYLAVADACPHMGASLGRGRIRNDALECSWHQWKFNVHTGACPEKAGCFLPIYDVKVVGDDLYLRLRPTPGRPGQPDEPEEEEDDWEKFNPDLYFKDKHRSENNG